MLLFALRGHNKKAASQEEESHQKPNVPALGSWTFQPVELQEKFLCFEPSGCGFCYTACTD